MKSARVFSGISEGDGQLTGKMVSDTALHSPPRVGDEIGQMKRKPDIGRERQILF